MVRITAQLLQVPFDIFDTALFFHWPFMLLFCCFVAFSFISCDVFAKSLTSELTATSRSLSSVATKSSDSSYILVGLDGWVHALDPSTGEENWKFNTGLYIIFTSQFPRVPSIFPFLLVSLIFVVL